MSSVVSKVRHGWQWHGGTIEQFGFKLVLDFYPFFILGVEVKDILVFIAFVGANGVEI